MDSNLIHIALMIAGLIVIAISTLARGRVKKRRHLRMQATASRQLDTINGLPEFRQRFAYLRKINHFVFEEMLLEALERAGHKVYRNSRYTGDGGIDGRVKINNAFYIIQAKRYSSHIDKQDVITLAALASRMNCNGLFCHTGKTRDSVKAIVTANNHIEIISGQRLLDLLEGKYTPGERKSRPNPERFETRERQAGTMQ